ncbi:MAG: response regulator [Deltaproteobacteria bacterium]|nr:response regulator [Deltaproteobacteria bacterium]
MSQINRLEGKHILIVDDEPDVLETLKELLPMCDLTAASTFEEARDKLETHYFDIAILDIMGVQGYELLKLASDKDVISVMLTANAMTPQDLERSYQEGAASFLPKEKMEDIELFLNDVLEARAQGRSLWWRWFDRLADYFEHKFGPDWQKKHRITVK